MERIEVVTIRRLKEKAQKPKGEMTATYSPVGLLADNMKKACIIILPQHRSFVKGI